MWWMIVIGILIGILIIGVILINIFIGCVKGIYKAGYKRGDYYRRHHNNQICIDCECLDACKNPSGYDGTGYCKWKL